MRLRLSFFFLLWMSNYFSIVCWNAFAPLSKIGWVYLCGCVPRFSILFFCFLNIHWEDWCWRWNSNTFATWCKELTHWKRPWCWERLRAGGEGDDSGWDGWMASPTWWTWVWVSSGSWWWTGRSGSCSPWGRRVGHNWATELNWTEYLHQHHTTLITIVR